jgi:hypothetical protein
MDFLLKGILSIENTIMLYSLLLTLGCLTGYIDMTPADIPFNTTATVNYKIQEAKTFCRKNGYDTTVSFLLDLSIHNGRKRFFVCNMNTGKILTSGLVTHGGCNTRYLSQVQYSNKPGCGCSSYGKYKVGGLYQGIFGDSYKLYGLDSSNSNAYKRYIVLHSHKCVPDQEIYPNQICNSEGCTTVSPAFLKELKTVLGKKKKPILLWVIQ